MYYAWSSCTSEHHHFWFPTILWIFLWKWEIIILHDWMLALLPEGRIWSTLILCFLHRSGRAGEQRQSSRKGWPTTDSADLLQSLDVQVDYVICGHCSLTTHACILQLHNRRHVGITGLNFCPIILTYIVFVFLGVNAIMICNDDYGLQLHTWYDNLQGKIILLNAA